MYSGGILSISEVNALTPEQFEWLFGNVVENYPDASIHVASMRPFSSVKNLKKCYYEYLEKLDTPEKENLLLKHLDFIGKLIAEYSTTESQSEEITEFESMSKEEKQILSTYNDLYKEKFCIPFVIHMRENKVKTILSSIQTRLQNTKDNELHVAIEEVKKICNDRINYLVWRDIF